MYSKVFKMQAFRLLDLEKFVSFKLVLGLFFPSQARSSNYTEYILKIFFITLIVKI